MGNSFYQVPKGGLPHASDVNQIVGALSATLDAGTMQLAAPTASPSAAPTVSVASGVTNGNLSGAFGYQVTFVTGIVNANGTINKTGETTAGPMSNVVQLSNQASLLNNIPTGPSTVVARNIYRTPFYSSPAQPLSLSLTSAGSSLGAGTYYVNYAYTYPTGTTSPGSSEASITVSSANQYWITFQVTLPQGATGILLGVGTASGAEKQVATISSSGTITRIDTGISLYVSVSGNTLTIDIEGTPAYNGPAMPTTNTATSGNAGLVATLNDNATTSYLDNNVNTGAAPPTSNTTGSSLLQNTVSVLGLNSSLSALRFVGIISSGPPSSGTYNTNDVILDKQGYVWVCTSGGSPGTWTSLQSVLNSLPIGGSCYQFTSSTSLTIPTYVTRLYVILVGGGGGGGGSGGVYEPSGTSQYYGVPGAGGGGGAAIVFGWFPVSGGPTLNITVGAGGAGGAGGPNTASSQGITQGSNGGNGGNTSISIGSNTIATAQGGQGGTGSGSSPGTGGNGGNFSVASNSILFGVAGQNGGNGSSSSKGTGGVAGTAPYVLSAYGNGGAGGNYYSTNFSTNGASGSNGQNGCVYVIW